MTLMRDLLAPFVEPFIQVFLLTFGDVPTILGLIVVQAILLAGQLSVVAGGLLRIDLTVRDTAIDAALLVVGDNLNS